jgi:hypothetical protein
MTYSIELDDYEVANLRVAIEAIGYPWQKHKDHSPLSVLNTGDWLGQLYLKLPIVEKMPNVSSYELIKRANNFKKPA